MFLTDYFLPSFVNCTKKATYTSKQSQSRTRSNHESLDVESVSDATNGTINSLESNDRLLQSQEPENHLRRDICSTYIFCLIANFLGQLYIKKVKKDLICWVLLSQK